MADFLSLLMGIPSIISNFRGSASPYSREQEQLAAQQAAYARASGNPSDPIYQNLYQQYQDQNRKNLAEVIAESQRQNRMASGMGRTPLFSAERGGESVFRNLMKGYQDMGEQSDRQTRAALQGAGAGTAQALQDYNAITPYKAQKNLQQDILGWQGIGNLFMDENKKQNPGYYPNYSQQQLVYVMPQSRNPFSGFGFNGYQGVY